MSAKALGPVCDSREPAAPWQPANSALSGSDRHDFACLQGFDIAHWGLAKESSVLAIELARAFVADLERCACRIQFTSEHALPRGMQAKPLPPGRRGVVVPGCPFCKKQFYTMAQFIEHLTYDVLPLI